MQKLAAVGVFCGLIAGFSALPAAFASPVHESTDVKNNISTSAHFPILMTPISDETLNQWLRESGLALVKSFAAREFPNVSVEKMETFQIGEPVNVYLLTEEQDNNGFPIIAESLLRLAPISDAQGNAVGVIQVELNKDNTESRQVFGDAKLGQSILPPPANSKKTQDPETLVYDSALKAWFVVSGKVIEAASTSGEKFVLGSVPIEQFFAQRKEIVSAGTTATSIDQQSIVEKTTQDSQKQFFSSVVVLLMSGIFIFSLIWLVWESRFEQSRKRGPAQALWNWTTGHRRIVRSEAQETQTEKIKFAESSGKVTLYQKPEKLKQQDKQVDQIHKTQLDLENESESLP